MPSKKRWPSYLPELRKSITEILLEQFGDGDGFSRLGAEVLADRIILICSKAQSQSSFPNLEIELTSHL